MEKIHNRKSIKYKNEKSPNESTPNSIIQSSSDIASFQAFHRLKLHISIPIHVRCFGFFQMILKIFVLYSPRNPTCRALSSLMYDNVSNRKKIRHVCSLVAIQISLAIFAFSAWTAEVDCELSVMPFRAANCSYTSQGSRKVGPGFGIFSPVDWSFGAQYQFHSLGAVVGLNFLSGHYATHVIIIKIYFLLSSCLPADCRTT